MHKKGPSLLHPIIGAASNGIKIGKVEIIGHGEKMSKSDSISQ
jgi:hypothetical protein